MSQLLDHRQIADEMEIFCLNDQVGAGLPIWLGNGILIREVLENWIVSLEGNLGFQRVSSPHLAKEELYQRSGHLAVFKEDMFPALESHGQRLYLRPMNCPHHHLIFASRLRSYRDLPLRIGELGQVYRHERSGSLNGLLRARGLCQNDGHIYVARDQAASEVRVALQVQRHVLSVLGLAPASFRLSCRDSRSSDFLGHDEDWLAAENLLRQALQDLQIPFSEGVGEAAFYGPKIDVQLALPKSGKEESIASIQLDFNSGHRFGLRYRDVESRDQVPWVIHRAPLGSLERLVAVLLEWYQGHLPMWLAPVQVLALPVAARHHEFVRAMVRPWQDLGLRVLVDAGPEKIGVRLARHFPMRPAVRLVIGDQELREKIFRIEARDRVLEVPLENLASVLLRRSLRPEGAMDEKALDSLNSWGRSSR